MPFKQVKVRGRQDALGQKSIRDAMLAKWAQEELGGTSPLPSSLPSPVIVGGFGNSGTRLVTNVLRSAGVDMGSRTNESEDAMCFIPIFEKYLESGKYRFQSVLKQADSGIDQDEFARDLGLAMALHLNGKAKDHPNFHAPRVLDSQLEEPWGWKNPRWFWFAPLLEKVLSSYIFIHVVRNGLERKASRDSSQSIHGQNRVFKNKFQEDLVKKGADPRAVNDANLRNELTHGHIDPEREFVDANEEQASMEDPVLWARINGLVADFGETQMRKGKYFRVRYEVP